jgi:short-subunit dehydrogenase
MNIRTVPFSVLITGASGGIGSALAETYAAPGVTLVLHGRKAAALASVAERCIARGAKVHTCVLDARDLAAFQTWLTETAASLAVDLVFVNAGVNIRVSPETGAERWLEVEELLDVNVYAALATVDALLPGMRSRGRGQIALISSLAGYFGLPISPSYCASKAALKAYGEAIRGLVAAEGVGVTVVMPGFVETPMEQAFPGPKPFLWSAERAARTIKRRLEGNPARISFPFPLDLGSWITAVLPAAVSQRLIALMGYGR